MPSYTTNLAATLPDIGQANWGGTMNATLQVFDTAIRSITPAMYVVPSTSSPLFNAANSTAFELTLSTNVTSSSFINGVGGKRYTFVLVQPSTPFAFVWPTNVHGAPDIQATANSVTTVTFICRSNGHLYTGTYN